MKKIVISLLFLLSPVLLVNFVLASGTTGTIDSTDKYAWSENLGWINFGTTEGNVQVTDSGLSGYAWVENAGWINLNPSNGGVDNDVNGNLSGYAWGENTGWINFNCSNKDSCGTVDYKVKTDWITLLCGNGVVEGDEECDDGNITDRDGCSSVCLTEFAAAGPPPTNPPQVSTSDEKISYLLINSGDKYTQSLKVSLSILAQGAVQMALSNSEDFSGISWEPYRTNISWFVSEGDGKKNIYIKFRSEEGGVSELISACIILDMTIPEGPIIIEPKNNQTIDQDTFFIHGTAEVLSKIIIVLDDFATYQISTDKEGNWSYFIDTPLKDGNHYVKIKSQDSVGWLSEEIRVNFNITTELIKSEEISTEEIIPEIPFKIDIPEKEQVPKVIKIEEIIEKPYDLIPEKQWPKIPGILKHLSEQIRKIPQLPKLTFPEEIAKSVVDEFIKPVVFSSVDLTKKISKGIFVQAPKFVAKKISNSWKLVTYQVKRLAILFKPPVYEDVVDLLPPLKKEVSRPGEFIEQEKLFFSSIYGNIELNQNKKGELNLIAGANIKSFIKPDSNKEIKSIKGQLLFDNSLQGELPSGFFPFKTAEAAVINKAQAKEWLVGQYIFVDNNNNGIYETIFQIPPVAGKYSFKTVIEYKKESIKEVKVEMLIDSEGYIYTTTEIASEIIEARLPNVKTTLFWLNPLSHEWQVWSAYSYDQKNPQTTNKTGQYSFLVPEGNYYLQVEKDGYQSYTSEYFEVEEGSSIHQNIELNPL